MTEAIELGACPKCSTPLMGQQAWLRGSWVLACSKCQHQTWLLNGLPIDPRTVELERADREHDEG
jgi:hypothetical protein